jgi:hypothetical protein
MAMEITSDDAAQAALDPTQPETETEVIKTSKPD